MCWLFKRVSVAKMHRSEACFIGWHLVAELILKRNAGSCGLAAAIFI